MLSIWPIRMSIAEGCSLLILLAYILAYWISLTWIGPNLELLRRGAERCYGDVSGFPR